MTNSQNNYRGNRTKASGAVSGDFLNLVFLSKKISKLRVEASPLPNDIDQDFRRLSQKVSDRFIENRMRNLPE